MYSKRALVISTSFDSCSKCLDAIRFEIAKEYVTQATASHCFQLLHEVVDLVGDTLKAQITDDAQKQQHPLAMEWKDVNRQNYVFSEQCQAGK